MHRFHCSCLVLLIVSAVVEAWSPAPLACKKFRASSVVVRAQAADAESCEEAPMTGERTTSRRAWLNVAAIQIGLIGLGGPAYAAGTAEGPTVYKSGKPPIVPGAKPQDKNDVKGTKKDPEFLRSVSDCRSQCQNTLDSDGLAKSKEDCLSECQDICCKTYAQCTFDIVPRI